MKKTRVPAEIEAAVAAAGGAMALIGAAVLAVPGGFDPAAVMAPAVAAAATGASVWALAARIRKRAAARA